MGVLIVFTGPESSGKTTWSKWFSEHMNGTYVVEYARMFLDKTGGKYNQRDLVTIAEGQLKSIKEAQDKSSLVISDTDALTIKVWSEEKYQSVDEKIIKEFHLNRPNYYVLCKSDIPWEEDPLRENPHDRDRLYEIYLKEIKALNIPCIILEGDKFHRELTLKLFKENVLGLID